MRIAHATDIHWTTRPRLGRMWGKRMLGGLNLALRRRGAFDREVQASLVEHMVHLAPDAAFITGDLTSMALEEEFALARANLEPLLEQVPTLVIPGNHDVYTRGAARERRIRSYFAEWMGLDGDDPVARLDVGDVTLVGLDPNRPGVLSSGRLPRDQLDGLATLLDELDGRQVVLGLHYPVLKPSGLPYDSLDHGLRNVPELVEVLRAARNRPIAILHGHQHHGYRVDLDLGDARVPIFNPGSSGLAFRPHRGRRASMNLYEIGDGATVSVERYLHGPDGWQPEPGGAYAEASAR